MPEEFQKVFTIQLPVHVRKKMNGVYEARFRKFGLRICVSTKDYDALRGKLLDAIRNSAPMSGDHPLLQQKSVLFSDVLAGWFELKKPSIKESTCKFYQGLFETNILPALGGLELREIRQSDIQSLINAYILQNKLRTATKIYQTLKAIFEFAVGEELIEKSPLRMLHPPKYEEKNGRALTLAEEREFIARLGASGCAPEIKGALLVLLYTGMRRSELAGAEFDEGFLSVVCAKVRKGFQERKRLIPITPVLARVLPEIDLGAVRTVRPDALTQAFKRLMPDHHLHELRHTYITRCQESGVAREVVSVWAGHAADNTQTSNVYTHFSREFMRKEAQKVDYN